MGQARIRGTKEERVRQGKEKRLAEEQRLEIARDERDKQEQLRVAAMSPEKRQRMYKNRALIIGVSLAFGLDIKYDV